MEHTRRNSGTCSSQTTVNIDDKGIIRDISIIGGCSGNIQGVITLAVGRPATEVAETLRGIRCGAKPTSCPDQLALCIEEALRK